MVRLRKSPICRGTLTDGSGCEGRVDRQGDRCVSCLERLATSPEVWTRRQLGRDTDLAPHLFPVLAADADTRVRLAIAERTDCPLVTLQRLEHDDDPEVRSAASSSLSACLTPRAFSSPPADRSALFSEEDLEALHASTRDTSADDGFEDTFFPVEPGLGRPRPVSPGRRSAPEDRIRRVPTEPATAPSAAEPRTLAAPMSGRPVPAVPVSREERRVSVFTSAFGDVLGRLSSLGERLSSLETQLSTTGDRLSSITDRLGELRDADLAPAITSVAAVELYEPSPLRRVSAEIRTRHASGVSTIGLRPARVARTRRLAGWAPREALPALSAGGADDVLPVRHVNALDPGAMVPADLALAAWLLMVPLLTHRHRSHRDGLFGPPPVGRSPARRPGQLVSPGLLGTRRAAPALAAPPVPAALNAAPQMADVPVADVPVADIRVADIRVADVPVADIPVADVPEPESERGPGPLSPAAPAEICPLTLPGPPPRGQRLHRKQRVRRR